MIARILLVALFAIAMIGLALRADARFRAHVRLPMQWSLAGAVNWTAPRRLALALIPAVGIGILIFTLAMMALSAPRAGQESLELPILCLLGTSLLLAQLLHLRLVRLTIERTGR